MKIRVKLVHKDAIPPSYATPGASGMDITSIEETIIPPGELRAIRTGIAVEIPRGYEAQIRPRSGLALKHKIGILNSPGTIDSDYRGEVKILAFNFGKTPFTVKKGMRIAQMVITPVIQVDVEIAEELSNTKRADGGFGHTGIH